MYTALTATIAAAGETNTTMFCNIKGIPKIVIPADPTDTNTKAASKKLVISLSCTFSKPTRTPASTNSHVKSTATNANTVANAKPTIKDQAPT